jgi:hypothetical protein
MDGFSYSSSSSSSSGSAYTLLSFSAFFPLYKVRLISSINSDNQSSDVFQVVMMVFINTIVINWKTSGHWSSGWVLALDCILYIAGIYEKEWDENHTLHIPFSTWPNFCFYFLFCMQPQASLFELSIEDQQLLLEVMYILLI